MSQGIKVLKTMSVNGNFNIQKGYLVLGPTSQTEQNTETPERNISAGSVYQKGNTSRSFINFSNLGTVIGFKLDSTIPILLLQGLLVNILVLWLPGIFPAAGGYWTSTQEKYDLDEILNILKEEPNNYLCKSLGMGNGNISNMSVGTVNKNGIQALSFTTSIEQNENLPPANVNILSNWSNLNQDMSKYNTMIYSNPYLKGFDWIRDFNIQYFNGTNSFPYMGWGGTRIGNTELINFQGTRDTLYDYPATDLLLSKNYDSLGTIYAGQGTQYLSDYKDGILNRTTIIEKNTKKMGGTIFSTKNKICTINNIPYQQGIGSYDFYTVSSVYSDNTSFIKKVQMINEIIAEGSQPGRNSAFAGVAITDFWSKNINFLKINQGSLTQGDTRAVNKVKQTQTAHNAPLNYIPQTDDKTTVSLPWNTLFSYVGNTTTTPNNIRSKKCPILQEGVTSMIITGAYPLYKTQWNSTVRPTEPDSEDLVTSFFEGSGNGEAQYYDFEYAGDEKEPSTPQIQAINQEPLIQVFPPYRIKSAIIILYEGQMVKAGSYVYSTVATTSNVSVPQYFTPSAKEIKFESGERDTLIGDMYSRYQGNQGGIIVMVIENGKPPPMPPSGAQPIGIVMEDLIGFGTAEKYDDSGMTKYGLQEFDDSYVKSCYSRDGFYFNNISGRELTIKLLPMHSSFYSSGVTDFVESVSTTESYSNPLTLYDYMGSGTWKTFYPIWYRTKTHYAITTGIFNGIPTNDQNWFYNEQSLGLYGNKTIRSQEEIDSDRIGLANC